MNMPGDSLIDIARRKERLIARGQAQRAAIAEDFRQLRQPIGVIDRGLAVVRFLRAHPAIVGIVVAAVVVLRGRGLVSMAGRGLTVWRIWRSLSAWSAGPLG
jgi:hypothetical protein